ncbi:LysR family transcriptional regulator [Pseudescherichia sp.]|uniref:LysR family transcriptional regulator n=1 Tax=Pseudescherichia sp. TaxID=2055881 RepID=UPI00289DCDA8|nr:LysR family transcriptional regulator [Pseudescherichia sp.]
MDMNLVKVFVAIYEQESVSGAADLLNITQPSVSYALKKMRDELNDELFIRQNTGMKPTRQAVEIYRTFSKAVGEIDAVVSSRKSFDHRTSRHKFVIAMSDLGEHYYLPLIFREITRVAPGVEIEILPLEIAKLQEWLDKGFVDAAICNRTYAVHDVHCDILLRDRYVCLKGNAHTRVSDVITLTQFLEEKHIVASSQAGHNFYQEWYAGTDRKLITALTVPDLNIVAPLVESSDCISVVPETYSMQRGRYFAVTALPLPIDFPRIEVCLYSQNTLRSGKEKLWFLKMLKDICLHNCAG